MVRYGIIVAKLNGHLKTEIQDTCINVGIMSTRAAKSNIIIGTNVILVTKANTKELERNIKLFVEKQQITDLLCFNENAISDSRMEVAKFINSIYEKYGIQTLFYKPIY